MTDSLPAFWHAERLGDMLDAWAAVDRPSAELYNTVLDWLAERLDRPHEGMARDPSLPNMWWGVVPGTRGDDGNVVVCSYETHEFERLIVCHNLARLSEPVIPGEPLADPDAEEDE